MMENWEDRPRPNATQELQKLNIGRTLPIQRTFHDSPKIAMTETSPVVPPPIDQDTKQAVATQDEGTTERTGDTSLDNDRKQGHGEHRRTHGRWCNCRRTHGRRCNCDFCKEWRVRHSTRLETQGTSTSVPHDGHRPINALHSLNLWQIMSSTCTTRHSSSSQHEYRYLLCPSTWKK
jgi:hypothetical protein